MKISKNLIRFMLFATAAFAVMLVTGVPVFASEAVATTAAAADINTGLGYLGAGIAVGVAAIGGGIAVGGGAPAAIGALTEDPKSFGKSLIFVALGEGIALYGLIIAILILLF